MTRLLLRLSQALLVLAVFCLANGSEFIAQGVAWGTMIVDYTSGDTVMGAVMKTFDGSHPCEICRKVDEQQSSQQKRAMETGLRKLDLCCTAAESFYLKTFASQAYPEVSFRITTRGLRPPLPPPRAV